MSNDNRKKKLLKIKKISNKKCWPLVCFFILSVLITFVLAFATVDVFVTYVASSKLDEIKANNEMVYKTVERYYDMGPIEGNNADKPQFNNMGDYMKGLMGKGEAICTYDANGKLINATGDFRPDIDNEVTFDLGNPIRICQDVGSEIKLDDTGSTFTIVWSLLRQLNKERENVNDSWFEDNVFQTGIWMKYTVNDGANVIYVRGNFNIKRQDVLYAAIIGILELILFLIPMTIMFFNMIRNVINQRRMVKQLYDDPIVDGKNWAYFSISTIREINKRSNRKKEFAIVNLHVAKYQEYCACYGMTEGDKMLNSISGYLKVKMDHGELYARHSAADYALLLKYTDKEQLDERLVNILAEMTSLNSEQKISTSAGVYIIEAQDDSRKSEERLELDVEQLYNYACEAGQRAKKTSGEKIGYFSGEMLDEQRWEIMVEDTMEDALINEEFMVYYQPKYNPVDNKLVAAEALVRWNSPKEGLIPPNKFIPIFENNGFITKLDDYMITKVSKQQAEWKIQGKKVVPVSVNVSRAHFVQDNLVEKFCNMVDSYGTSHKIIEFEVTESAFLDDKKSMINVVTDLRKRGFAVSMDDFGAGYSSLNSLKELPLDIVKIDGEFFRNLETEEDQHKSMLIVSSVIQLAKQMDMKVVAEGVEEVEQRDFLAGEGCDMIQGYYYSKPLPKDEFIERVQRDA